MSQQLLLILFLTIAIVTMAKLFSFPIRRLLRLCCSTAMGFAFLAAFNSLSTYLPITLGFNLLNAAVIGIFGIPGFLLLVLLRWLCG